MSQSEMLQEHWRRAVHERTAEPFATTNYVDQTALVERLEHATDRHATNLLDLGATDRLTVCNNGECLERGRGETLRARRELRPLDCFGVFGARENLPTTGDLLQLDAVTVDVVMLAQLIDRRGDRRGRGFGRECRELFTGYRASAREERRLKQLR